MNNSDSASILNLNLRDVSISISALNDSLYAHRVLRRFFRRWIVQFLLILSNEKPWNFVYSAHQPLQHICGCWTGLTVVATAVFQFSLFCRVHYRLLHLLFFTTKSALNGTEISCMRLCSYPPCIVHLILIYCDILSFPLGEYGIWCNLQGCFFFHDKMIEDQTMIYKTENCQ